MHEAIAANKGKAPRVKLEEWVCKNYPLRWSILTLRCYLNIYSKGQQFNADWELANGGKGKPVKVYATRGSALARPVKSKAAK